MLHWVEHSYWSGVNFGFHRQLCELGWALPHVWSLSGTTGNIQLYPMCLMIPQATQALIYDGGRKARYVCVCIYIHTHICMGFPGSSVVKSLPVMQETQV